MCSATFASGPEKYLVTIDLFAICLNLILLASIKKIPYKSLVETSSSASHNEGWPISIPMISFVSLAYHSSIACKLVIRSY